MTDVDMIQNDEMSFYTANILATFEKTFLFYRETIRKALKQLHLLDVSLKGLFSHF